MTKIEELKKSNCEKEKANRELSVFQHTYNKIQRDFTQSVNDSRNHLQVSQSHWDAIEKKSTQFTRHDFINIIRALREFSYNSIPFDTFDEKKCEAFAHFIRVCEENLKFNIFEAIYDIYFGPAINKIQQELRGLEKILDLEPEK